MPDSLGPRTHVTDLLRRWGRGDRDALERLMPLGYRGAWLHRELAGAGSAGEE